MVHFRQCSPGCSECPHTVRGSCPVLYLDSEPFIRPRMSRTVFCMSRTVNNRKSLLFEYLKPLTVTKRLQKRLQMFVTYQAMPKPILGMCNIPYCTVNRGPRTPPNMKKVASRDSPGQSRNHRVACFEWPNLEPTHGTSWWRKHIRIQTQFRYITMSRTVAHFPKYAKSCLARQSRTIT